MTILKRLTIDFFLIAIFAGLIFLISMPFLAELEFNAAARLIEEGKWDKAELKFERAIKIDPFNSRYISGYADFLLRYSSEYNNKEPIFARSERLYTEAARILELVRYANVHNQKPLVEDELAFIAGYPEIAQKIFTMKPEAL